MNKAISKDSSKATRTDEEQRSRERDVGHLPLGPAGGILALQRSAGNRAVDGLLQSGTNAGRPAHDLREEPPPSTEDELKPLPSANASLADAKGLPGSVRSFLSGSSGRPMEPSTRAFMEGRFGYDFSDVRMHTDSRAVDSARAVGAQAYTTGRNVVFGKEQFTPGTAEGKELLAHELAHVVQQGQHKGTSDTAAAAESEADRVATKAVMGQSVSVDTGVPGGIQCKPLREEELELDIAEINKKIAENEAQVEGVSLPAADEQRLFEERNRLLEERADLQAQLDAPTSEDPRLQEAGERRNTLEKLGERLDEPSTYPGRETDKADFDAIKPIVQEEDRKKKEEEERNRSKQKLRKERLGRSFKKRLSNAWLGAPRRNFPKKPTPEEVWEYGLAEGYFEDSEKERVLGKQRNAIRKNEANRLWLLQYDADRARQAEWNNFFQQLQLTPIQYALAGGGALGKAVKYMVLITGSYNTGVGLGEAATGDESLVDTANLHKLITGKAEPGRKLSLEERIFRVAVAGLEAWGLGLLKRRGSIDLLSDLPGPKSKPPPTAVVAKKPPATDVAPDKPVVKAPPPESTPKRQTFYTDETGLQPLPDMPPVVKMRAGVTARVKRGQTSISTPPPLESPLETLERLSWKPKEGISIKGGGTTKPIRKKTMTKTVQKQLGDLQESALEHPARAEPIGLKKGKKGSKKKKGPKSKPPLETPLERLRHAGPNRPLTNAERATGAEKAPGHEVSWEQRRSGGETVRSGQAKSGVEGTGPVPMGKKQVEVHTEGKVIDIARKHGKPGDTFYMDGVRVPCGPLCQPALRKAAMDLDITFVYRAAGESWTFLPSGRVTVRYRGRTYVRFE